MEKFIYTKDDGSVSERVLHGLTNPGHHTALDVTGLSEEEQTKAARLYDQWKEEHLKPFDKKAAQFKKENLKTLETFFEENGIPKTVMVKSFKPAGLVKK